MTVLSLIIPHFFIPYKVSEQTYCQYDQIKSILQKAAPPDHGLVRPEAERLEIGERGGKGSRRASQSIQIIYRDIGTYIALCCRERQDPI